MKKEKKDIYWHEPSVRIGDRWESNKHKSCLLWFTGLSASGKSTIAHALSEKLHKMGVHSYVLDGDNIRHGLNKDLGLSPADRKENIRRIGEVAKLFIDAGLIVITAFISPYKEDRAKARKLVGEGHFIEVYVRCSFEECARRDPKGLYKRALAGEIKDLTGHGSPYEEPEKPEIIIETETLSIDESVAKLLDYLMKAGFI
jgi:adenylylsulfate kinase